MQIADADTVADVYNNVIYATNYGIRLQGVDLTPVAQLNIFNNTIYGSVGGTGPSGIKSTVRQTTTRVDLRNNIVHSNNTGDIGISPPFDRAWFANPGYTNITASVADSTVNATLNFTTVGTDCLYLGSQNPFRGVAYDVADRCVRRDGPPVELLERRLGEPRDDTHAGDRHLHRRHVPAPVRRLSSTGRTTPLAGSLTTVSDATPLYYVRACLASGPPATKPVERQITRADLPISSTANLSSDMTGLPSSPRGGFVAGQNAVPLASVNFVNTTVGSENLHLQAGSAALNVARTLNYDFDYDIDATLRPAGAWDVGADEHNGTTEVRLMSFSAAAGDASVALEWRTASELDNLGFHVYRAPRRGRPVDAARRRRSSRASARRPRARRYSFRDAGLANGTRYFYRLEDVDASSKTTSHGPVSAVPLAGGRAARRAATRAASDAKQEGRGRAVVPGLGARGLRVRRGRQRRDGRARCTRHGDPEAVSLERRRRATRDRRRSSCGPAASTRLHEASGARARLRPRLRLPAGSAGGGAAVPPRARGRGRRPPGRSSAACARSTR